MRILERYVLREHLFPFFLGLSVVVFLLTLDFLFDLVDLAIGKGVGAGIVLELFALSLGWMMALAVPCAVLIAALATFGRLSQDNEIAAMRANGVNLMRIIAAPLLAAAVLGLLLVGFNNYVLPETNHRLYNLMVDVSRKRPTTQISEGVFVDGFEGYNIFVEKVNNRTNEIRGVKIYQLSSSARPTTILADWGVIHNSPDGRVVTLELHDGEIHEVPPNDQERVYRRLMFKTHIINIRNVGADLERSGGAGGGARGAGVPTKPRPSLPRGGAPSRYIPPVTMDLIQMRQLEVETRDRRISGYEVEINKKISIPAACLVFVLVGAPLGIRARRSGMGVAFISILFFVFYYLCLAGGEELADRRIVEPWLAMWIPNIVIGAIGTVLTLQAAEAIQRPRRRPRRATHA